MFERSGEIQNCPDCASPRIRYADEREQAEYIERQKKPEDI